MIEMKIVEQISNTERIVSTKRPDKLTVFVHQFQINGEWKTCLDCGKGLPGGQARPGPVRKIDRIRKYCPKYRSTNDQYTV